MQDIQRIKACMPDKKRKDLNVVAFLKNDNNEKNYILYTFSDEDNTSVEVYVSIFKENKSSYELAPVETDMEWDMLQESISNEVTESGNTLSKDGIMHVYFSSLDDAKEANIMVLQKICEMPKSYLDKFNSSLNFESKKEDNIKNNSVESALDDLFEEI